MNDFEFDETRPVYHATGTGERVIFYDVFRGTGGRVFALAPVYATEWTDAGEQHRATFDPKWPPVPLVGTPEQPGYISDVFLDQGHHHYLYGCGLVYPKISRFHWHAVLFVFDTTAPAETELKLWYTVTRDGSRHRVDVVLPDPPERRFFCAAATMYRDDEAIIGEWLDHCAAIGFDRFLLYDNFSDTLLDLAAHPEALVIDWPHPYYVQDPPGFDSGGRWSEGQGLGSQIPQQMHALWKYGRECEWIAFIDTDEYLNLLTHDTVRTLLGDEPRGVVQVGSLFFGNAEVEDAPDIRHRYLLREPPGGMNGDGYGRRKTIVNPARLLEGEHVGIHDFNTARDPQEGMRRDAFANDVRRQVPLDEARLNHYFAISSRRRDSEWPPNLFSHVQDETILR